MKATICSPINFRYFLLIEFLKLKNARSWLLRQLLVSQWPLVVHLEEFYLVWKVIGALQILDDYADAD